MCLLGECELARCEVHYKCLTPARQTALHANPQLSTPPTDSPVGPSSDELATWSQRPDGGIDIMHRFPIKQVAWHARGDYFSTVAPTGNTQVRVRLGVQRKRQLGQVCMARGAEESAQGGVRRA